MARDRLGDDEGGQLMILAAVLLVVGLIALAGMVGRVNQLGSQTSTESDKAILDEVVPLASALQDGIAEMRGARTLTITSKVVDTSIINVNPATPFVEQDVGRHISSTTANCVPNGATISDVLSTVQAKLSAAPANTAACTARLGAVVTGVVLPTALTTLRSCSSALCSTGTTVAAFSEADVGLAVTGSGIPPGTVITGYTSSNSVTISASATSGAREVSIGRFALTSDPSQSTPTIERGVVALLEYLQKIEAGHGLLLDYELKCPNPVGEPLTAYAYAHLSDGTVWVEVQSSIPFTVTSCSQSADCPVPDDTDGDAATIFTCG